jgi:hypothetical protein
VGAGLGIAGLIAAAAHLDGFGAQSNFTLADAAADKARLRPLVGERPIVHVAYAPSNLGGMLDWLEARGVGAVAVRSFAQMDGDRYARLARFAPLMPAPVPRFVVGRGSRGRSRPREIGRSRTRGRGP